jgi:hypothetical protein
LSIEVAAIGDDIEFVHAQGILSELRHPRELPAVIADVGDDVDGLSSTAS